MTSSTPSMEQIAQTLLEIREQINALRAEEEMLTYWLKSEMDANGQDTATGENWIAEWKAVAGRRIDTQALQAAEPEIAEKYAKTTVQAYFQIKRTTEQPKN